MEMACDILAVISAGAKRPTRIMYRANLPWKALLMYLEVLMRHGFVSRQFEGTSATYHLTSRGLTALSHYYDLREDMTILRLDTLTGGTPDAKLPSFQVGVEPPLA
ncbi:MAG: hypothetical protein KGI38_11060 [Thaumarchaeota archaeon]|nr:hypothetical protein [Nitrososphaerota archaeon]